jgi:hypothetical protein
MDSAFVIVNLGLTGKFLAAFVAIIMNFRSPFTIL